MAKLTIPVMKAWAIAAVHQTIDRDAESDARPEAVVEASADTLADGVRQQQQAADETILPRSDMDIRTEACHQQTDGTAVDVIDAGDEENQGDDPPAQAGKAAAPGIFSNVHRV